MIYFKFGGQWVIIHSYFRGKIEKKIFRGQIGKKNWLGAKSKITNDGTKNYWLEAKWEKKIGGPWVTIHSHLILFKSGKKIMLSNGKKYKKFI